MNVPVIVLDGPSGTGKSSVSIALAERLAWHRLESGVLYRLVALELYRRDADVEDLDTLQEILEQLRPEFRGESVLLNGEDVRASIRGEEIGTRASRIASRAEVRSRLVHIQRSYRRPPGLVAEGRDMGTVVFPDAPLKIFLDAGVEERALRRHKQLKDQNINVKISALVEEMSRRDSRDRTRRTAPLVEAVDAEVLDTTRMKINEVTETIMHLWRQRQASNTV